MSLSNGKHRDHIGYFIVREQIGTAELEVIDAEAFEDRDSAETWIEKNGEIGVDYWICAPFNPYSLRRS